MMVEYVLRPAARAFDAVAPLFNDRFGAWRSVAAQRRVVRSHLRRAFPPGSRVLEVGGGNGEDAAWLAQRGVRVVLTDAAPAMVAQASQRLKDCSGEAHLAAAEDMGDFAECYLAAGATPFDGVFSNFAPLNCVEDLAPVAQGLARLVRPGGAALLVMFGTFCPGEIIVETLRGRPHQCLRRLKMEPVPARLGAQEFTVVYHRKAEICRAMAPWFRLVRRRGIGVLVPPSAAEPEISRHPWLLGTLAVLDLAGTYLAPLGDHVLYHFERLP